MIKHIFSYHPEYVSPLPIPRPAPLYEYEVLFYDEPSLDELASFLECVWPTHYLNVTHSGSLLTGWLWRREYDE
jgi:hypothetical protein